VLKKIVNMWGSVDDEHFKNTLVEDVIRHAVTSIGTDVSKEPATSIFGIYRGRMFLRNIGTYLPKYMASYPSRQ
jgi:hypothetical protein